MQCVVGFEPLQVGLGYGKGESHILGASLWFDSSVHLLLVSGKDFVRYRKDGPSHPTPPEGPRAETVGTSCRQRVRLWDKGSMRQGDLFADIRYQLDDFNRT